MKTEESKIAVYWVSPLEGVARVIPNRLPQ